MTIWLALVILTGIITSCGNKAPNEIGETSSVIDTKESLNIEAVDSKGCENEGGFSETGSFIIGMMKSGFGSVLSRWLLDEYLVASGAKVEFMEYISDKEMIDAARSGEIDLVCGNDLVSGILAYEGRLFSLDPVIAPLYGTGEYYDSVLNAGRIGESFLIAVPYFEYEDWSTLQVPAGTVNENGRPDNIEEIKSFYGSLEKDRRACLPFGPQLLLDSMVNLAGRKVGNEETFRQWTDLQKRLYADWRSDASESQQRKLFSEGNTAAFIHPEFLKDAYSEDGKSYTRFGSDAALIPFSLTAGNGYVLQTVSLAIPKAASHPAAAMAFVEWIFSEDGQEHTTKLEANDGFFFFPVKKSENRKYIDKMVRIAEMSNSTEDDITKSVNEHIVHVEAHIVAIDRLPSFSHNLSVSFEMLLDLRRCGAEERRRTLREGISLLDPEGSAIACSLLITYMEKEETTDPVPRYFEEGTFEDWPEYLAGFLADYLADLGYEVTKAG